MTHKADSRLCGCKVHGGAAARSEAIAEQNLAVGAAALAVATGRGIADGGIADGWRARLAVWQSRMREACAWCGAAPADYQPHGDLYVCAEHAAPLVVSSANGWGPQADRVDAMAYRANGLADYE